MLAREGVHAGCQACLAEFFEDDLMIVGSDSDTGIGNRHEELIVVGPVASESN
jgi:hypothetical protein